jgi:hypothetical protein
MDDMHRDKSSFILLHFCGVTLVYKPITLLLLLLLLLLNNTQKTKYVQKIVALKKR